MDKNETTTYARHVWLGGHIYTEDDQAPLATALACEGQKLIYVGDDETAQKLIGPNTLVTDLKGHTVVPGFIEGHAHLQSYGESLLRLRIRDLSRQEILKAVGEAVKELAPGTWLVGGMGWNNEVWSEIGRAHV